MALNTLLILGLLTVCRASALTKDLATDVLTSQRTKRQALSPPTGACTDGDVQLVTHPQDLIWRCTNKGKWLPYRLTLALGTTEELPGCSCKVIKEALTAHWFRPPQSGLYWVTLEEGCGSGHQKRAVKVYCDMTTDGGGWTLMWKNSFWDNLPLSEDMFYFSKHYRPCEDYSGDWCNIPNKGRCKKTCCPPPTEMMIVAYHNRSTVYAYKGHINNNIDWDWTGGRLLYPTKIEDHCTYKNGVLPAPSNHAGSRDLGVSFDKHSPDYPYANCDTIGGDYASPGDCRWHNCRLPSHISSSSHNTQMTLAIYVR